MLALSVCGGRSVEVNTLGCGPGGEGSIPSGHPIFSVQVIDHVSDLVVPNELNLR